MDIRLAGSKTVARVVVTMDSWEAGYVVTLGFDGEGMLVAHATSHVANQPRGPLLDDAMRSFSFTLGEEPIEASAFAVNIEAQRWGGMVSMACSPPVAHHVGSNVAGAGAGPSSYGDDDNGGSEDDGSASYGGKVEHASAMRAVPAGVGAASAAGSTGTGTSPSAGGGGGASIAVLVLIAGAGLSALWLHQQGRLSVAGIKSVVKSGSHRLKQSASTWSSLTTTWSTDEKEGIVAAEEKAESGGVTRSRTAALELPSSFAPSDGIGDDEDMDQVDDDVRDGEANAASVLILSRPETI